MPYPLGQFSTPVTLAAGESTTVDFMVGVCLNPSQWWHAVDESTIPKSLKHEIGLLVDMGYDEVLHKEYYTMNGIVLNTSAAQPNCLYLVSIDGNEAQFDYAPATLEAYHPYIIAVPGNRWGADWDVTNVPLRFEGSNATIYTDVHSSVSASSWKYTGFEKTSGTMSPFSAWFVNKPAQKGVYIHNGRKVIIK